jgi:hypothetical protein
MPRAGANDPVQNEPKIVSITAGPIGTLPRRTTGWSLPARDPAYAFSPTGSHESSLGVREDRLSSSPERHPGAGVRLAFCVMRLSRFWHRSDQLITI